MVAIVEAILSGTTKYFADRSNNASLSMENDKVLYFDMITKYTEEKSKNGEMHRAFKMGTRELRFELMCRDKGHRGTNRERITYECTLRCASCVCTCSKPLLLHRPCSHVMAACSTVAQHPGQYLSDYFTKEAVTQTWSGEMYGYAVVGHFTGHPTWEQLIWAADIEIGRAHV